MFVHELFLTNYNKFFTTPSSTEQVQVKELQDWCGQWKEDAPTKNTNMSVCSRDHVDGQTHVVAHLGYLSSPCGSQSTMFLPSQAG